MELEMKVIRLLYYLPMERMEKEKKVHLEWAKVYWPQDYEVVNEMKILKEENKKLKKRVIELEKEREFLLEAHSVSAE